MNLAELKPRLAVVLFEAVVLCSFGAIILTSPSVSSRVGIALDNL